MESFEITFFYPIDHYDCQTKVNTNKLIKQIKLFTNKEILVECFAEENKNYAEVQVSIFELEITKDNLNSILREMSEFVSIIFREIPHVKFATGIYELTYYFTENIIDLNNFNNILKKFPVIFLRCEQKYNEGIIKFENNYIKCIFQENAQALY
jgi:CRISPR/Cas system-associated endoribonuclease Cas2